MLLLSMCVGCAGHGIGSGQTPTIMSFTASPDTVTIGQATTLSWSVNGATNLSITYSGGTVTSSNSVTLTSTSVSVNPAATTTYILTASNPGGESVTALATVAVVPAPVISSFTATPATIVGGQSATLNWSVTNATNLSISPDVGPVVGNSVSVTPTTTTTYTLTATNGTTSSGAVAIATTIVTVVPAPVITSFTSNPAIINSGQSSTLGWSVSGATSLAIDNGVGAVTGSSVSVSPTTTTTYTLTASNTVGTFTAVATAHTTVTISSIAVPTITSFVADHPSVGPGGSVNLTAVFDPGPGGGTATVDNGVGTVVTGQPASSGPLNSSTTFTLSVANVDSQTATAKIRVLAGRITWFAGTPTAGGYVDLTGTAARFSAPQGLATDKFGNIYVADTGNHVIRKINTGGGVSTLAGIAGTPGNQDSPGALFNAPQGIAVDASGDVFVADTGNNTVRMITPAGFVTTLIDASTRIAAQFNGPQGLAVDASGNVYVADTGNETIDLLAPSGPSTVTLSIFAGTPNQPGNNDSPGALFNGPQSVALDSSGNLYVADTLNYTVRKITSSGVVTTVAGAAGVRGHADGAAATFDAPYAVAVDSAGNIYVADSNNVTIRRITTPALIVSTIIGTAKQPISPINGVSLPGHILTPRGIALDSVSGNLYFSNANAILSAPY